MLNLFFLPSFVSSKEPHPTDNSWIDDGYRFHDAFHVAFLGVLGWSPVLRSLLRLKRKSQPQVDECEDGARAYDVEEGISSLLAKRAPQYNNFLEIQNIDNETLDIIAIPSLVRYELNRGLNLVQ